MNNENSKELKDLNEFHKEISEDLNEDHNKSNKDHSSDSFSDNSLRENEKESTGLSFETPTCPYGPLMHSCVDYEWLGLNSKFNVKDKYYDRCRYLFTLFLQGPFPIYPFLTIRGFSSSKNRFITIRQLKFTQELVFHITSNSLEYHPDYYYKFTPKHTELLTHILLTFAQQLLSSKVSKPDIIHELNRVISFFAITNDSSFNLLTNLPLKWQSIFFTLKYCLYHQVTMYDRYSVFTVLSNYLIISNSELSPSLCSSIFHTNLLSLISQINDYSVTHHNDSLFPLEPSVSSIKANLTSLHGFDFSHMSLATKKRIKSLRDQNGYQPSLRIDSNLEQLSLPLVEDFQKITILPIQSQPLVSPEVFDYVFNLMFSMTFDRYVLDDSDRSNLYTNYIRSVIESDKTLFSISSILQSLELSDCTPLTSFANVHAFMNHYHPKLPLIYSYAVHYALKTQNIDLHRLLNIKFILGDALHDVSRSLNCPVSYEEFHSYLWSSLYHNFPAEDLSYIHRLFNSLSPHNQYALDQFNLQASEYLHKRYIFINDKPAIELTDKLISALTVSNLSSSERSYVVSTAQQHLEFTSFGLNISIATVKLINDHLLSERGYNKSSKKSFLSTVKDTLWSKVSHLRELRRSKRPSSIIAKIYELKNKLDKDTNSLSKTQIATVQSTESKSTESKSTELGSKLNAYSLSSVILEEDVSVSHFDYTDYVVTPAFIISKDDFTSIESTSVIKKRQFLNHLKVFYNSCDPVYGDFYFKVYQELNKPVQPLSFLDPADKQWLYFNLVQSFMYSTTELNMFAAMLNILDPYYAKNQHCIDFNIKFCDTHYLSLGNRLIIRQAYLNDDHVVKYIPIKDRLYVLKTHPSYLDDLSLSDIVDHISSLDGMTESEIKEFLQSKGLLSKVKSPVIISLTETPLQRIFKDYVSLIQDDADKLTKLFTKFKYVTSNLSNRTSMYVSIERDYRKNERDLIYSSRLYKMFPHFSVNLSHTEEDLAVISQAKESNSDKDNEQANLYLKSGSISNHRFKDTENQGDSELLPQYTTDSKPAKTVEDLYKNGRTVYVGIRYNHKTYYATVKVPQIAIDQLSSSYDKKYNRIPSDLLVDILLNILEQNDVDPGQLPKA